MTDALYLIPLLLLAYIVACLLFFPQQKRGTGAYSFRRKSGDDMVVNIKRLIAQDRQAYDPSQDPEKIMQGESESYFD